MSAGAFPITACSFLSCANEQVHGAGTGSRRYNSVATSYRSVDLLKEVELCCQTTPNVRQIDRLLQHCGSETSAATRDCV